MFAICQTAAFWKVGFTAAIKGFYLKMLFSELYTRHCEECGGNDCEDFRHLTQEHFDTTRVKVQQNKKVKSEFKKMQL